jgi:hypothetical protein
MAKNRQLVLFENWFKGLNTRQKLSGEGFSKQLQNFDATRGGALQKVRNVVTYPIPTGHGFTTIDDFCLFTGNSKTYLVVFGDAGTPNNPKIRVHDGTSWGTVWDSTAGYMPTTTTGVIFVPSFVGGVSCLRVYPQAADPVPPTQAHMVLLRPLLIFEHEEKKKFEKWAWDTLSTMTSYYNILFNGTKTVSMWEMPDTPTEWAGTKITCSCGRLSSKDSAPHSAWMKPCVPANDNTSCSIANCASAGDNGASYAAHRCNFIYDAGTNPNGFQVGDIAGFDFFIPYGTPETPLYFKGMWMARVTSIENAVTMYVTPGVRRFISATGSFPIQGVDVGGPHPYFFADPNISWREGWISNLYRIRAANLVPTYGTPVSAGLACLKGMLPADSTLLSSYFSADRIQTSDWLPAELFGSTMYEGSEYIRYGVSYVSIDGCHSNIAECSVSLPKRFLFNPASPTYKDTYVCLDQYGDGFTLLRDYLLPATLTGASEEVRKRIKGANVWRWGPGDDKWMLLAYIPYIPDEGVPLNPVDHSKVFYDSNGEMWQSHSAKQGLAYWTKGIVDAAQPLAASVFDTTGGLEEADMGKEYAAKTAATIGRKIYIGNLAPVVAADGSTLPTWKDDEIRFSLFDKGANFNRDDYLSIATGDPDQVVKIGFFGRQMIVAKKAQVFIIDLLGTNEGTWKQVALFKNGILNIEQFTMTSFGPVWISVDGVMFWNGEQLVNLTENILDDYRNFYKSYSATACIGFDRLTSKVYVTEPSVGQAYVIELETGTLSIAKTLKAKIFRNDPVGRAIYKPTASELWYPEAKAYELTSGYYVLLGGASIWESSEIDLVKLAGESKLYRLYFYVTYKKTATTAQQIKLGVSFDGASTVETLVDTLASTAEQTTVFELDVWKRGKIVTISINTNDAADSSIFEYFRVWKIAATVRVVDID